MKLDPAVVARGLQSCDEIERRTRAMLTDYPDMPAEKRAELTAYLSKIEGDRIKLRQGLH